MTTTLGESRDNMAAVTELAVRQPTLSAMRAIVKSLIRSDLHTPAGITGGHILVRLIDYLIAIDGPPVPIGSDLTAAWAAMEGEKPFPTREQLEARLPDYVTRNDSEARNFVRTIYASEFADICRKLPEAAAGVDDLYFGGRAADEKEEELKEPPLLTVAELTTYLGTRFPEKRNLRVVSFTPIPGGMSKQTYKVATESGGTLEHFVIRKDMPGAALPRSVVLEYPTLVAVWKDGGVPVAEPLWLEPDPAELGTPAMAVRLVEGSGDVSSWSSTPSAQRDFAESLAKGLARLHSITPPSLENTPEDARGPTEQHVAAEIERWYNDWRNARVGPRPVLEAVFAWLRANIPSTPHAPALVHGDLGFHNMLMRDGNVTALLDWEYCHIGDPAEDLVYCRPFLERVIDWDEFLALYEEHGGLRPSAEADRFYAVWRSARNAAACTATLQALLTSEHPDAKYAVAGLTFLPRFELDAFSWIVKPQDGDGTLNDQ